MTLVYRTIIFGSCLQEESLGGKSGLLEPIGEVLDQSSWDEALTMVPNFQQVYLLLISANASASLHMDVTPPFCDGCT